MLKRSQVLSILKANGFDETCSDEQIRHVLSSISYNDEEIKKAIDSFRGRVVTDSKNKEDGLHKVFRTNDSLSSEEISSLLGVEVNIDERINTQKDLRSFTNLYVSIIIIMSIFFGLGGIMSYMYFSQTGIFHPDVGIASLLFSSSSS